MSREVDERIVRLEFENKGFEKNAKKSSSTLEKLKAKMDFRKEAKSMDDAFDGKRFNVFVKGLDKVKASFTSLEAVAFSTINNITNRMVDASIKMAKSLSIDNVAGGWASYNSINETKAALKAQGFEAKQVGKALDKLKWFSDETSYSFDNLTKSMNSFISTGRTMEESMNIVMGIAGATAMASQKPEKAFNALLQLSQEAGSYLTGNTWISMRNAGLDTEQFKKNVLEAAEQAGTLVKLLDGSYISTVNGKPVSLGNFQQSLSDTRFFTGEVLAKLGEIYSKGTNEIYDAVESTGKLTYEVMKDLGKRMDEEFGLVVFGMLQKTRSFAQAVEATKVAVQGSWTKIFEIIFGDEDEATTLWSDLAERMIEFAGGPYEKWINLLNEWKELGGRDDLFGEGGALWNLIDAFEKLRDVIRDAFNEVFHFEPNLKGFTEWLKNATSNLILSDEAAENLKTIFKGIFSLAKIISQVFQVIWQLIKIIWPYIQKILDYVSDFLVYVAEGISSVAEGDAKTPMEKLFNGIKNFFLGLWEALKTIAPVIGQMAEWFGEVFTKLGDTLKKIFTGEQGLFEVKDLLTLTIWAALIAFFWWMASSYISWQQTMKEFVQSITDVFDSLAIAIKANALKKFVTSIIMLVAAIAIIGSMDPKVLSRGVSIVGLVWAGLILTMKELKTAKWTDSKISTKIAAGLLLLSLSILPLVGVIAILGSMPREQLSQGIISMLAIVGSLAVFASFIDKNVKQVSNLYKASGAIAVLGLALTMLIVPILALIGTFSLFAFAMAKAKEKLPEKTLNEMINIMIGVMAGIMLLVGLAAIFGDVAGGSLLKAAAGIAAFGVALIPFSAGILALGLAIGVVAGIMRQLGSLDVGKFYLGMLLFVSAAAALTLASLMISAAIPILLVFSAVIVVVSAVLAVFALALTAVGSALASFAKTTTEFSNTMSEFDFKKFALGILKLVGALALFTVVGVMLLPVLPVIALVTLAFSVLAIVLGNFTKLLNNMGGSFKKSVNEIKDNVDKVFEIINYVAIKGAEKILELIDGILAALLKNWAPITEKVFGLLFSLVLEVLDQLIVNIGPIIAKAVTLLIIMIQELANSVGENAPEIAAAIKSLLWAIVNVALAFFGLGGEGYNAFEAAGGNAGEAFGRALVRSIFPFLKIIDSIGAIINWESETHPVSVEDAFTRSSPVNNLSPVPSSGIGFTTPSDAFMATMPAVDFSSNANSRSTTVNNFSITTFDAEETANKVNEIIAKQNSMYYASIGDFYGPMPSS